MTWNLWPLNSDYDTSKINLTTNRFAREVNFHHVNFFTRRWRSSYIDFFQDTHYFYFFICYFEYVAPKMAMRCSVGNRLRKYLPSIRESSVDKNVMVILHIPSSFCDFYCLTLMLGTRVFWWHVGLIGHFSFFPSRPYFLFVSFHLLCMSHKWKLLL